MKYNQLIRIAILVIGLSILLLPSAKVFVRLGVTAPDATFIIIALAAAPYIAFWAVTKKTTLTPLLLLGYLLIFTQIIGLRIVQTYDDAQAGLEYFYVIVAQLSLVGLWSLVMKALFKQK